ncbi:MAG: pyridoxamine 5'-phosphate oxidase family protein, partial [Epibacterium sp.]|nr:pyridoxamine 5'-phosphate oxidase family protein [Epibacterium sp.]NQX75344.1 pyridoxamine 5'-phosphate oxidase family protein [Epibacterium sp.]
MGIAKSLNPTLRAFVERQPIFFVATADVGGRVNVSPKGMDTMRVLDGQTIRWLNLSGSGNETAAH